jgi:alanine dehydrogenase
VIVGIPKEIKPQENRVGAVPAGVSALTARGHTVLVERGAGAGSGLPDAEYATAGAELVDTAEELWGRADLVWKVKEPVAAEYPRIREGQVVYAYLHLAPDRTQTEALLARGCVAIAFETIEQDGRLPALQPMSEVAGRLSIQMGARALEKTHGGRGVLLGGVPGVPPGQVVVLGAGSVGRNAARMAMGLGARVTVLDIDQQRLRWLDDHHPGRIETLYSTAHTVEAAVRRADLLVGGVLVAGARAPTLVPRELVAQMKRGAAIVDVAIDQGGCIETIRPTTHAEPMYVDEGVVHYGVTNMPGAVPRTSTFALQNATLPWALALADKGWRRACEEDAALARGLNVVHGQVVYRAVAEAHGLPLARWRDR